MVLAAMLSSLLTANSTSAAPLSGRVLGLEGNDHVVIKVVGPQTYRATTRTGGAWILTEVAEGDYTITPIHSRYTFAPEQRTLSVSGKPVADLDFQASPRAVQPGSTRFDRETGDSPHPILINSGHR